MFKTTVLQTILTGTCAHVYLVSIEYLTSGSVNSALSRVFKMRGV